VTEGTIAFAVVTEGTIAFAVVTEGTIACTGATEGTFAFTVVTEGTAIFFVFGVYQHCFVFIGAVEKEKHEHQAFPHTRNYCRFVGLVVEKRSLERKCLRFQSVLVETNMDIGSVDLHKFYILSV